jgi:hypothetical protein
VIKIGVVRVARSIEMMTAFLPMSVEKSDKGKNSDWYIEGLASTPDMDYQGDIIRPDAIDYKTVFEDHGWITYEHGKDVSDIIGEPIDAFTDEDGFHIKGKLYKASKKAQEVWNFQNMVSSESSKGRTLGFSIEGPIIARDPADPRVITKVQIKNVTVTYHPANPYAKMEVATKSIDVADLGYEVNPEKMSGISALQRNSVSDAIALLSYVINKEDKDEVLIKAQAEMEAAGLLNDSSSALILQLGRGVSRGDALGYLHKQEE